MALSIRASSTPLGSHAGHGLLKSPFAGCNNSKRSRKQASIARAYISTAHTNKDPYTTLGLPAGASEHEIKKAYRRLALQFHPDVCKGDSCTAKFIQIGQAYESIMDCVRGRRDSSYTESCYYDNVHETMMGVNDDSWEDWEDWMGWEGAGTRDYSSHINYAL